MGRASESNRAIARMVAEAFEGQPNVTRYHDDADRSSTFVAARVDSPVPGTNSYATLGLSDFPLIQNGAEYPCRLEILIACENDVDYFDRVLATAAFCVINDQWFCAPGYVFPNVIRQCDNTTSLPHLYFTTPFLWGTLPQTMELPDKTVAFLQAVPISDDEDQYLRENGSDALESRFEALAIDVCDPNRRHVA
nr:suppressor of fused domain protein [Kibdelosporangium sp. MJ126-NF4]CEL18159.1 unknown [Kibdelosporangium sp. MJ126-NF4]CTQ90611.1 unknown [Kibdelosporangium sp. MJ126-NF4]